MKKIISLSIVALFIGFVTQAQFVVRVRPSAPVIRVRPACPSPNHVWVGGNYARRGNQYVYNNGYWAVPPSGGNVWVDGHWKQKRRGWVWVPGHWRRF